MCIRDRYDKSPQGLLDALLILDNAKLDFEISVVGQTFGKIPDAFQTLQNRFESRIVRWGYQESREQYWKALAEADVFVSTANHEFFGLSPAEAIVAGAYPLFPDRLAYPELLRHANDESNEPFLYDGTPEGLAAKLIALNQERIGSEWHVAPELRHRLLKKIGWEARANEMDDALMRQ